MELLKNIRAYEDVFFEDPEENPDTPRFRVWFDDKHIEEYLAKVGNAGELIAKTADSGGYDLVVMGSHGQSALGNLVMGSVATKVLAQCKVPVLLVR